MKTMADYNDEMARLGITDREAARAYIFFDTYGDAARVYDADDNRCVVFDTPMCGEWGCITPSHQVLKRV